jgi:hypothetical protein
MTTPLVMLAILLVPWLIARRRRMRASYRLARYGGLAKRNPPSANGESADYS